MILHDSIPVILSGPESKIHLSSIDTVKGNQRLGILEVPPLAGIKNEGKKEKEGKGKS